MIRLGMAVGVVQVQVLEPVIVGELAVASRKLSSLAVSLQLLLPERTTLPSSVLPWTELVQIARVDPSMLASRLVEEGAGHVTQLAKKEIEAVDP